MKYILPLFALFLIACAGGSDDSRTDDEKMRDEVRAYLFLDDSVAVSAQVVDTILVEDLDGMLLTIEENLIKVQWDIDTLSTMIDDLSYEKIEEENRIGALDWNKVMAESYERDTTLLLYHLKMSELQSTKLSFQQSKRVMLHLRRAQMNTVAGYEVVAKFNDMGEDQELAFLMTPEFKIVD